jgi:hypothetical protein
MSQEGERKEVLLTCDRCGTNIECCAVCEGDECSDAICYRCLRLAVGQAVAQPHVHGG